MENWNFAEKTCLQTIAEKAFAERHKIVKFAKVSLSIVPTICIEEVISGHVTFSQSDALKSVL